MFTIFKNILPKRLADIESLIIYFLHIFFFKKKRINRKFKSPNNKGIVIFGSGSSINNISDREWTILNENYDSIGFNHFYHCKKIKLTYYVIREFQTFEPKIKYFNKRLKSIFNLKHFKNVVKKIDENKNLKKTNFIYLNDYKSGTAFIMYHLLKKKYRTLGFYSNLINREKVLPISENFKAIPHGKATLIDAINISYLLGYKKIILAGVDLYDRRYFFLNKDETRGIDKLRGANFSDKHNTSHLIDKMEKLSNEYNKKGISLFILNEKSLLNKNLPIIKL